jgi:putative transposase
VPDVIDYIQKQRDHHKKQTFEDEYIALLNLHEIEYDERYVFD